jgi:hypothetical protein
VGHDTGLGIGATLTTAMLSPCVGGLVRTWIEDDVSRLWRVANPSTLSSVMGQGIIARTLTEERRFREVGLLHEPSGTLLLPARSGTKAPDGSLQVAGDPVQLTEPGVPTPSAWSDFKELLGKAVRFTVEVDGFLVVERGGWDAPHEPYCLFLVVHERGEMSVLETAPAPTRSRLWEQSLRPGAAGATLSGAASEQSLGVVPTLMIEACATWGIEPWDLALTYGKRS